MNMSATDSAGIGIPRLGQVAIRAKDVDRAAAFYQDKLDLSCCLKRRRGSHSSIAAACA
jgi:catechol-2,3-dioxygenase